MDLLARGGRKWVRVYCIHRSTKSQILFISPVNIIKYDVLRLFNGKDFEVDRHVGKVGWARPARK